MPYIVYLGGIGEYCNTRREAEELTQSTLNGFTDADARIVAIECCAYDNVCDCDAEE